MCCNLRDGESPIQKKGSKMANLGDIERRLNSDPQAREAFFADPVAFLAREGLMISEHDEARLRERIANLQKTPPSLPGGLAQEKRLGNIRLIIRDELS
jgi:hypothetical protein